METASIKDGDDEPLLDQGHPAAHRAAESLHFRQLGRGAKAVANFADDGVLGGGTGRRENDDGGWLGEIRTWAKRRGVQHLLVTRPRK